MNDWQGILISGPPGTGKTLLARAIARESGLPFVFASGAEFVESSTGNGSDKIFDIFFTARANVSICSTSVVLLYLELVLMCSVGICPNIMIVSKLI